MKRADGGVKELNEVEFDEFEVWFQKKQEKKKKQAAKTAGQLMTKGEFIASLTADSDAREAAAAKAEENQKRRVERAEAKIIAAYEREQANAKKLDAEQIVRETLVETGFWSSNTEFVTAKDMACFVKANATELRKRGYKSALRKDELVKFLTTIFETCDDCEWNNKS
eukprot:SAG31_NODE_13980_length_833_cov_2.326975_2_plen_168_part_00